MTRRLFGCIYTAVLTAGTAEIDVQAVETAFDKIGSGDIHQIEHAVQEDGHIGLLLQVIDHRLVFTGKGLVLVDPARVQYATAIEYKATAVAAVVGGYTMLLVTEAGYFYHQG